MKQNTFKEYIAIFNESITYERQKDKVIARLTSYDSTPYTKLANKIQRLEILESEIKEIKDQIKVETKEHIQSLFDAEDVIRTRIVDTVSFILTLSKDPKPAETLKYKEIISELSNHLTPELLQKLEELKKKYTTFVQKSPALTLALKESKSLEYLKELGRKFLGVVYSWSKKYDKKLNSLKNKKQILTESRLREFRGWWKIGESEPEKIWFKDEYDNPEHAVIIFGLDRVVAREFYNFNEEDDIDNLLGKIIEFSLSRGWIRFGQMQKSVHGSQTFIHYDNKLGLKAYYTVLKIIDWLNLDNDDEISLSGNASTTIYNRELDTKITVSEAKRLMNNTIRHSKTAAAGAQK